MNERLEKFFQYSDGSGMQNLYGYGTYIKKPDKIKSLAELEEYEKKAVSEIEYLKSKIELLNQYRAELYNRYQEIHSTNYQRQVLIERQRRYYENKVYYYVTVKNIPDRNDVAEIILRQDRFEGKKRHKALKLFDELCKTNPRAEAVKKIEKSKYER